MITFELRAAVPSDIEDITEIWSLSFGDPAPFVSALLLDAKLLPTALCAVQNGRVRSVMFAFEGLSLAGTPSAYLYALCTHPDARGQGMGTAVVRALAQRCFERGAKTVFLSPADAELATWYAHIFDTGTLLRMADVPVPRCDDCAVCEPIEASDYLAARHSGIGVTLQLLIAQQTLHRFYGGGFFRIRTGAAEALACASSKDETLLVRELICSESERPAVCAALAKHFGCKQILLREASANGPHLVYIIFGSSSFETSEPLVFPYLLE